MKRSPSPIAFLRGRPTTRLVRRKRTNPFGIAQTSGWGRRRRPARVHGPKRWWGGFSAVILAAGKGTRMRSDTPKALQTLCGVPMLLELLSSVEALRPKKIIVVGGFGFPDVKKAVGSRAAVVRQTRLLGSGHAVMRAEKALRDFRGAVLVLYCDTSLIPTGLLRRLLTSFEKNGTAALLSVELKNPEGYGRILRCADGGVEKIVEETDTDAALRKIREINVGAYVFEKEKLFGALGRIRKNPHKKEYYLTDVIEILARQGRVTAVKTDDPEAVMGINTRLDLMKGEAILQKRILETLIEKGVRIRDPKTTVIDADVKIGEGTRILPHTVIEEGSVIGKNCIIGPFARVRGRSRIADGAVIGNFVEIVRSVIGEKTQVKHLSYLGDAVVGRAVNVGAGTITANFDGKKKQRTIIRDGARLGSGTVLIAPVEVGRQAVTGAGAVVPKGKNVPPGGVVVGVPAQKLRK